MKIEGYKMPKSSFLSVEKDAEILIDAMLKNTRLKKLLYHTTKDALVRENLTEEQTRSLIENENIKFVPKIYVDGSVLNYIIISFDNFTETNNPEFRDNIIEFDIICHFDQWKLNDLALRPYKIAGEIDSMFNYKELTGLGRLEFLGANQVILNNEFAGLCLMYKVVHGGEDQHFMATSDPKNQADHLHDLKVNFKKDFNDTYRNND